MTVKKNQSLQNGSAKVGGEEGERGGQSAPRATGSSYRLCRMNTSHI